MIQSSIIIPVHNNWELTRACLESIAANTHMAKTEILVVDNASHDLTRTECSSFGARLFGNSFRYIRNEENRNFSGASNQGASAANGSFLVFLNNDTEVQPGWLEPLMEDFKAYPNIGATGPILLYPQQTPMGRLVQHLGILVTPFLSYGHLYEGIPASSPLARKRRFFQAITGACLVMRKELFMEAGAFDEGFINGFEDVDLCSRLWQKGLRMTVNPASFVLHHESMTPGRRDHETENSERLLAKGPGGLFPDWHIHLKNDGLDLNVTPWLLLQPEESGPTIARLDYMAANADSNALEHLLAAHPYWFNGWRLLIEKNPEQDMRARLFKIWFRLFRDPALAMNAIRQGANTADAELEEAAMATIRSCAETPEATRHKLVEFEKWCKALNMRSLAVQYEEKLANFQNYMEQKYLPLARDFLTIAHNRGMDIDSRDPYAYALWLHGQPATAKPEIEQKISLIMPVLKSERVRLTTALDAILAQNYANWELLVIIDKNTDNATIDILAEYMALDARIRYFQQPAPPGENTRTDIAMPTGRWILFIDRQAELARNSLRAVANAIAANPRATLLYSDHDHRDMAGNLFDPCFNNAKLDWELLPALNFAGDVVAFRADSLLANNALTQEALIRGAHELVLLCSKNAKSQEMAHIPSILYHCQESPDDEKDDGMARMPPAIVQDWLDARSPGAIAKTCPATDNIRIIYELPGNRPMASLIISGSDDFTAAHGESWPHEIICVPEGDIEAANEAGHRARGKILGFLHANCKSVSTGWLETLANNAIREDVGAVGARVGIMNNGLAHGGYLADASGLPQPLLAGAKETDFREWTGFARTVDALDGLCMFTRKDIFLEAGGFNQAMTNWAIQDYCLRMGVRGLRSIWIPFACLSITSAPRPEPPNAEFISAWKNRLPPFSPHALATQGGFGLRTHH